MQRKIEIKCFIKQQKIVSRTALSLKVLGFYSRISIAGLKMKSRHQNYRYGRLQGAKLKSNSSKLLHFR